MKTTVVPAQITTVEDRIAGTLTFPQIVLLVIPLILGAALYSGIPPKVHFSMVKIILIGLQWLFFGTLALRIKSKILGDWLVLYLRFATRPRLYIFTKNDLTGRDVITAKQEKVVEDEQDRTVKVIEKPLLTLNEKMRLDQLFANPLLSIRIRLARKGGADVILEPVKE